MPMYGAVKRDDVYKDLQEVMDKIEDKYYQKDFVPDVEFTVTVAFGGLETIA